MRVEAILSQADLVDLIAQLTPVTIRLTDDGELFIHEPSDLTLVAGTGLRFVCKAKLQWKVLGLGVPVTLNSLTVMILPAIAKRPDGDVLVFRLRIEHADLAGIPAMVDSHITDKVNAALAKDSAELVWRFVETLSHEFALPTSLAPVEAIELGVTYGEVNVTAEALTLAVSYRANITRHAAV